MASHTSSKEARNKAVSKYVGEKYNSVLLRFPKLPENENPDEDTIYKETIVEHSEKTNETLTAFIKRAIKETMENDNKKTQS